MVRNMEAECGYDTLEIEEFLTPEGVVWKREVRHVYVTDHGRACYTTNKKPRRPWGEGKPIKKELDKKAPLLNQINRSLPYHLD